jgi:hypothetical protein
VISDYASGLGAEGLDLLGQTCRGFAADLLGGGHLPGAAGGLQEEHRWTGFHACGGPHRWRANRAPILDDGRSCGEGGEDGNLRALARRRGGCGWGTRFGGFCGAELEVLSEVDVADLVDRSTTPKNTRQATQARRLRRQQELSPFRRLCESRCPSKCRGLDATPCSFDWLTKTAAPRRVSGISPAHPSTAPQERSELRATCSWPVTPPRRSPSQPSSARRPGTGRTCLGSDR